jgi:hypothetical protein
VGAGTRSDPLTISGLSKSARRIASGEEVARALRLLFLRAADCTEVLPTTRPSILSVATPRQTLNRYVPAKLLIGVCSGSYGGFQPKKFIYPQRNGISAYMSTGASAHASPAHHHPDNV